MFPIFSYSLGSYTTSHKQYYMVPTPICPNLLFLYKVKTSLFNKPITGGLDLQR